MTLELTERGEHLAGNSYCFYRAKAHIQALSASDDQMDYGIDRKQKERLLNELAECLALVAELAAVEIPGEDE